MERMRNTLTVDDVERWHSEALDGHGWDCDAALGRRLLDWLKEHRDNQSAAWPCGHGCGTVITEATSHWGWCASCYANAPDEAVGVESTPSATEGKDDGR